MPEARGSDTYWVALKHSAYSRSWSSDGGKQMAKDKATRERHRPISQQGHPETQVLTGWAAKPFISLLHKRDSEPR